MSSISKKIKFCTMNTINTNYMILQLAGNNTKASNLLCVLNQLALPNIRKMGTLICAHESPHRVTIRSPRVAKHTHCRLFAHDSEHATSVA